MRRRKQEQPTQENFGVTADMNVAHATKMSPEAIRVEALKFALSVRYSDNEHNHPTIDDLLAVADRLELWIMRGL